MPNPRSSQAPAVRRARGVRLLAVAVLTAVLAFLGLAGVPPLGEAQAAAPAALLARTATVSVPYTATAVSFGSLGLPDLPRLSGVADLLGSATRTRVLWAAADRWRVDVLQSTGERGTYVDGRRTTTWDYGQGTVSVGRTEDAARLPRPDDLLPPRLVRVLAAGADDGDLSSLGARTVAGRTADGVRLTVAGGRSTVDHADVWVDRGSGLALEVRVVDVAGTTALLTRFESVDVAAPDADALDAPAPPGARYERASDDLAALADENSPWRLPASLADLPATAGGSTGGGSSDGGANGVVAYGSALTRLVVVPLPPDLAAQAVRVVRATGGVELEAAGETAARGADALLLRSGALTAALVRDGDDRHAYLVAGTVTPDVVDAAVAQLLADPPARAVGRP